MPVTQGGGPVRLTAPGLSTTTTTHNYLKSLPPSFETLKSGLALFAVFIIARFCAITVFGWFQRLRGVDRRPYARQHHHQPYPRSPWAMDEKAPMKSPAAGPSEADEAAFTKDESFDKPTLSIAPNWDSSAININDSSMPRPLMARPPPAPPLTPPELSTAVFTFEDRPRPGDDSFMSQPNPDYMSSTTADMTTDMMMASSSASPPMAIPRRRSYNKTLPIGVPFPISQQSPHAFDLSDAADLTFSPSSYPPTSPLLPPPPPSAGAHAPEIDVQGQIIGVLDGDGAGWTRHTRVYGGGICLACVASGRNSHEGGFYGATVRPEEMR